MNYDQKYTCFSPGFKKAIVNSTVRYNSSLIEYSKTNTAKMNLVYNAETVEGFTVAVDGFFFNGKLLSV